jgi:hypothetical protein
MKTLIAVPSHDMVHAEFTRCLMELDKPEGTGFALLAGTLIYTARNVIAHKAVEAGFDQVLWLDSDMIFPSDTLLRLSEEMQWPDVDFVTAVYHTRRPPFHPCIYKELHWTVDEDGRVDTGSEVMYPYPKNNLFDVAGCGFGCCITSAPLLKRMIDKYGAPFYPLMGMGEDLSFCHRANEIGETLFCTSKVKVGHVGQYIYDEKDFVYMEDDEE